METVAKERRIHSVEQRVEVLETTLLELVTALGMLVSELAERDDLALSKPEEVERALDRGWAVLVEDVPAEQPRPYLYEVPRDVASIARDTAPAAEALRAAMAATGAAVGIVYELPPGGRSARLIAGAGFPDEVLDAYRTVPLDADLPVSTVARTGKPLWFRERGEIVERYPHLLYDHERTEAALGASGMQGAVVPLTVEGRVAAVLLIGFTRAGAIEETESRLTTELAERVARALGH